MRYFFARLEKNANCWEILKIFDENSIEKLHFYFILENVTNNSLRKNTIFLQDFSVWGGGDSPWLCPFSAEPRSWPFLAFATHIS